MLFRSGLDFIGRLWNESAYPEDPVETYKRITGVTQKQFLTEMYDCAAKFATWDIPALKSYGSSKLLSRPTVKMNNLGDYTWQIDSTMCPENYGHNIIRLNAPSAGKVVSASFEGIAGASGFRTRTVNAACWNFGFVAYLRDGSSVYSDMSAVTKRSNIDTVRFEIPANCRYLWLVVSAGPSTHWKHPWDNNDANDEQWPYQVKFDNTNLYGQPNVTSISNVSEDFSDIFVDGNQLMVNNLADAAQIMVVDITGRIIINDNVTEINNNYTLPSGIYIVKVVSGGQLQTKKIIIQN